MYLRLLLVSRERSSGLKYNLFFLKQSYNNKGASFKKPAKFKFQKDPRNWIRKEDSIFKKTLGKPLAGAYMLDLAFSRCSRLDVT